MTDPGFKASAGVSNTNVATLAFDWSAAAGLVAAGDFALLVASTSVPIDTPSGWTPAPNTPTTPDGTRASRLTAFTKSLVSGDITNAATFQMTATGADGSCDWSAIMYIGGPASLDVAPTVDITQLATAGTSVQAPSISPVSTNTRCVWFHGNIGETSAVVITWTADAATTERRETSGASGSLRNQTLMCADQLIAAAGATGTRTATASGSVRRTGLAFALNAGGGAAGDLVPAKATLAMTSTSPTLTQASNGDLVPAKATLPMLAQNATLTVAGTGDLVPAKMTLAMSSASPTLTQAVNGTLVAAKATLPMLISSPSLSAALLVVAGIQLPVYTTHVTLTTDMTDPVREPIELTRTLAADGPLVATMANVRETR